MRECRAQRAVELAEIVDGLEVLHVEAAELLEELYEGQDSATAVVKIRPLQTTAEYPNSESCSEKWDCANAQCINEFGAAGAVAYEDKPSEISAQDKPRMRSAAVEDDIVNISLPLLRLAFVHLPEMVPELFDHWAAFRSSGGLLCRLCYVNPQVYQEAVEALGPDLAIVALALTAERSADGSVANPGGYLRALVSRSRQGTLRLSRSLFGMAASSQRAHL